MTSVLASWTFQSQCITSVILPPFEQCFIKIVRDFQTHSMRCKKGVIVIISLEGSVLVPYWTHYSYLISYFHIHVWLIFAYLTYISVTSIFQNNRTDVYLYDITFTLDRCHRSWAAETHGKYEGDWNYITYPFAKSKFPIMEKLMKGASVIPTPGVLFIYNERPLISTCGITQGHLLCPLLNSFQSQWASWSLKSPAIISGFCSTACLV